MKKIALFLAIAMIPMQNAWCVGSGGFTDQVVGTKALGMGNTFVATADDPSAIYYNPAGLVQLGQPTVSLGFAPISSDTDYNPTGASGNASDSMESFLPIVPNFYVTVPFQENKWVFGFGIHSPFGLETHWKNTGPLRYVATDSRLSLINFNPTLAYMINDKISLGAGVVYGVTNASLRSRVNQSLLNTVLSGVPTVSPDGGKKLEGDGDAWGYNFGVLYKPHEKHSLGLAYRSELKTHIEGTSELSGLTGTAATLFGGDVYKVDTETNLDYPQSLLIGYAFKPNKWTFEIDGEWVGYSTIDDTLLTFKGESNATRLSVLNTNNPIKRDWHNTWNLGLGANYEINETWQARGGYYYFPEVIPTSTWDPGNPEASRNAFTLGGSFIKPCFVIDVAYNILFFNDRTINNTVGATSLSSVNGAYETTAHILSTNFTYKFGSKS